MLRALVHFKDIGRGRAIPLAAVGNAANARQRCRDARAICSGKAANLEGELSRRVQRVASNLLDRLLLVKVWALDEQAENLLVDDAELLGELEVDDANVSKEQRAPACSVAGKKKGQQKLLSGAVVVVSRRLVAAHRLAKQAESAEGLDPEVHVIAKVGVSGRANPCPH